MRDNGITTHDFGISCKALLCAALGLSYKYIQNNWTDFTILHVCSYLLLLEQRSKWQHTDDNNYSKFNFIPHKCDSALEGLPNSIDCFLRSGWSSAAFALTYATYPNSSCQRLMELSGGGFRWKWRRKLRLSQQNDELRNSGHKNAFWGLDTGNTIF